MHMQREEWRVNPLFTLHVHVNSEECLQTKEKGKSSTMVIDWGTVKTAEAGHSQLFTCNVNSGECLQTKEKRRGKGRAAWRWWTKRWWKWRRPIMKGSCSPLMNNDPFFVCFSFSLFLAAPLSTVCNTLEVAFC